MNAKKLLWVRSCCLGNINMSVGKAAWSNLKNILLKHLAFHHYVADLILKRFLWTWSSWHADQNMSVGRPPGSSTKVHLRTPSQKIHHLCYYVVLNHLIMFCTFFIFIFLCYLPWKSSKKSNLNTVWCCSDYIIGKCFEIFGLYNLKPPRLGGLWRSTQGLDGLWYV
jgi:hypothetical protein